MRLFCQASQMTSSPSDGHSIATEIPNGWSFRIDPPDLTFIRIDHQVRLQFSAIEVVIETPFELSTPQGTNQLDPAGRAGLGLILAIYPTSLVSATSSAGTLNMRFEGAVSLSVPPHSRHEAWQINGPRGFLFVCTPGGDTALWT
jgi:hypothetical protein